MTTKDYAIGFFIVALIFGGIFLLSRNHQTPNQAGIPLQQYGHARVVATAGQEEYRTAMRHYQNKETRRVEYNPDGLFTFMEITRDYWVA